MVQVFASTESQSQYQYYYSAYNLTGSLVGSYQSAYPAAAFELPAGGYLFTVSAVGESQGLCRLCVQPLPAAYNGNSSISVPPNNGSGTMIPVPYMQSASEYGFKVEQVSGPVSITIPTINVTQYPVNPVSVRVTYLNGTAAAGASVSGSVVGQWSYWWGGDSRTVMWNQTDSNGIATLVLPSAPAVVSAWNWVPIDLPQGEKTVTVTVGGQPVNVTVYWEPTYVGLGASSLLLPPASSVTLTLQYQQPQYWAAQGGGTVAPASSGASVSSVPTAVPSATAQGSQNQYYSPSVIPPIRFVSDSNSTGATPATQSSSGTTVMAMEAVGLTAVAAAVVGFVILVARRTRTPS